MTEDGSFIPFWSQERGNSRSNGGLWVLARPGKHVLNALRTDRRQFPFLPFQVFCLLFYPRSPRLSFRKNLASRFLNYILPLKKRDRSRRRRKNMSLFLCVYKICRWRAARFRCFQEFALLQARGGCFFVERKRKNPPARKNLPSRVAGHPL